MEAIFHEKQEGSLCAQHCVNALLQGSYFTAVDLAEIGKQLDETERATMAEAGTNTQAYQNFLQQPSNNYDDSGFFSIQVLQEALKVWGLELLPITHSNPVARTAKQDPRTQQAYICNFREHWLTVRKIGNQWFNLNSLLTGPELISDTYLAMFLKQLETEGYSMYIVLGPLPHCEADDLLKLCPAVQPIKPKLLREPNTTSSTGGGDDPEMQRALQESAALLDSEDNALQQALKLSMQGYVIEPDDGGGGASITSQTTSSELPSNASSSADVTPITPSAEEVRKKRLAFLDKKKDSGSNSTENSQEKVEESDMKASDVKSEEKRSCDNERPSERQPPAAPAQSKAPEELSEEEMLKRAVEMSMQPS